MSDDLDPRFNPVFQRGHEDDAPKRVELVETSYPKRVEPVETLRRHNPWLPTLWIISLAILAFGVWAQWHSVRLESLPNLDNVTEYYVLPNVLAGLAPWFVGVGLASLVGVVFLHAVRWRP